MSAASQPTSHVAIACGGTGGHLFPGLAVAEQLIVRGCEVTLIVSPKEVDQRALQTTRGMEIVTLPALGLRRGGEFEFLRGFSRSYRAARKLFRGRPPRAALAMGGFTSAAPILAAKAAGARTSLHESNTIPGRANRLLSWVVNRACVGFPSAADRLHARAVSVTGTPVRSQFRCRDSAECRFEIGLDPIRPTVLVMGGSQGAGPINELVMRSLPSLVEQAPDWQWIHLAGGDDSEKVRQAYKALGARAVVHPFFDRMEIALSAATAAISRAGASSLAEIAAVRLPTVLVPYPAATGNHQFHNARAFEQTGAARLLEQRDADPRTLSQLLTDLMLNPHTRHEMQSALAQWHSPRAAEQIADAAVNGFIPEESESS
jgi:UDP-N-acetylglucosamine--N-acetylmuramyl-(pentapeptide) pyrophosphoryl-undecaprenol N-acetylglucosamine transferase